MVVDLTGLVSSLDLQSDQLARGPGSWCPEVLHGLVGKSADSD